PPEERGEVPHDSLPLEEYEGALLLKGPESSFIPKAAYTATTDNKLQILTSPRGAATQEFHFLTDGTRVASRNFLPGPSGNFVGLLPKDGQGGEVDHSTLRTFKLSPDGEEIGRASCRERVEGAVGEGSIAKERGEAGGRCT